MITLRTLHAKNQPPRPKTVAYRPRTDRRTDGQTHRQTERQTDSQTKIWQILIIFSFRQLFVLFFSFAHFDLIGLEQRKFVFSFDGSIHVPSRKIQARICGRLIGVLVDRGKLTKMGNPRSLILAQRAASRTTVERKEER